MASERVNADFSQRVVIATNELPWIPSPQAGVERRLLDRIGGEVGPRHLAGALPARQHIPGARPCARGGASGARWHILR